MPFLLALITFAAVFFGVLAVAPDTSPIGPVGTAGAPVCPPGHVLMAGRTRDNLGQTLVCVTGVYP